MADDKRERTQTVQFEVGDLCPQPASAGQAYLTVIRGGDADLGRCVAIESAARLGRDPDCELCLADRGVSWHHARISAGADGGYRIEDSGSTNGTRLDGRLLQGAEALADGQKIFLGGSVVRFALADALEAGFQQQVAHLVGTDPLTGLESKRRFDDALDHALAAARTTGEPLAVLMMDLDGIKAINDAHGHLFGAHCIRTAGRLIGRLLQPGGHACRWGGDEFSAFVTRADRRAALELAERIRTAIAGADMRKDGVDLRPTISIGVAVFPADGSDVLDLVAAADRSLYRAKRAGRNRVAG